MWIPSNFNSYFVLATMRDTMLEVLHRHFNWNWFPYRASSFFIHTCSNKTIKNCCDGVKGAHTHTLTYMRRIAFVNYCRQRCEQQKREFETSFFFFDFPSTTPTTRWHMALALTFSTKKPPTISAPLCNKDFTKAGTTDHFDEIGKANSDMKRCSNTPTLADLAVSNVVRMQVKNAEKERDDHMKDPTKVEEIEPSSSFFPKWMRFWK